jgi:hypothetical protein
MGYIRKHKDDIRSGFVGIIVAVGILLISPLIIIIQASSF